MNLRRLQEKASTYIMNRIKVLRETGTINEERDALEIAKMAIDRTTATKAISPSGDTGYACPRCGHHFEGKQHYCHNCGQHVSYVGTEDQQFSIISNPQEISIIPREDGNICIGFGGSAIVVSAESIKESVETKNANTVDGAIEYKSYF